MNTCAPSDLEQFHRFVAEMLSDGLTDLAPEACLGLWRSVQPSQDDLSDSVAAIRVAIAESNSGLGRRPEEILADLRAKYNLPTQCGEA